jgi:hypothetical protein
VEEQDEPSVISHIEGIEEHPAAHLSGDFHQIKGYNGSEGRMVSMRLPCPLDE